MVLRIHAGSPGLEATLAPPDTTDTTRTLEVGPGGKITQAFTKDNDKYTWMKEPIRQVAIPIVEPQDYYSRTGGQWPVVPEPTTAQGEADDGAESRERNRRHPLHCRA